MPATRLYWPTTGTPPISPAVDGSWEGGPPAGLRLYIRTTRQSSSFASGGVTIPASSDFCIIQGITDPISAAGAAALASAPGTVKGIFRVREGSAGQDLRSQMHMRVLSGDGTVVRGTLLAHDAGALSNEWATTLTNRKFPLNWAGAGAALTAVPSAVEGDRVVVEIGPRNHVSVASFGYIERGDNSPNDCAEDETGTAQNNGWIETSVDLFGTGVPPRRAEVSHVEVEVPSSVVTSVLKLWQSHIFDGVLRPDSILGQMDMLMVQYGTLLNDPGLVSRVKGINPNLKVIIYFFPQTPLTGASQFVTTEQRTTIINNDWILRNPAGGADTRVRHPYGGSTLLLGDMGNQAFRNYFIDDVMNTWIIPYGLDGYMNDGPAYTGGFQGISFAGGLAPTSAQLALYRGDNPSTPNATFFTELKAALGPNRILSVNTPQQWSASANYVDTLPAFLETAGRADSMFLEAAFTGINSANLFSTSETTQIDHHFATIERMRVASKTWLAAGNSGSTSGTGEEDLFRWLFHCYLLQADGVRGYISYWPHGRPWSQARIDYMKSTANALGTPRDDTYFVEAGTTKILRRTFAGGFVRVNKSATLTEGSPPLGPRAFTTTLSPDTGDRAAQVSQVEGEVPDPVANRQADVSQVEAEFPDPGNRQADVSQVEAEFPDVDRRAEVSWVEFQCPLPPGAPPETTTEFGPGQFPAPGGTLSFPDEVPFPEVTDYPPTPAFPT